MPQSDVFDSPIGFLFQEKKTSKQTTTITTTTTTLSRIKDLINVGLNPVLLSLCTQSALALPLRGLSEQFSRPSRILIVIALEDGLYE